MSKVIVMTSGPMDAGVRMHLTNLYSACCGGCILICGGYPALRTRDNGVIALFSGDAWGKRAAESFRDTIISEASLNGKLANISVSNG